MAFTLPVKDRGASHNTPNTLVHHLHMHTLETLNFAKRLHQLPTPGIRLHTHKHHNALFPPCRSGMHTFHTAPNTKYTPKPPMEKHTFITHKRHVCITPTILNPTHYPGPTHIRASYKSVCTSHLRTLSNIHPMHKTQMYQQIHTTPTVHKRE